MAVEFKRILIQPMFDPLAVETIVKTGFHLQGSLFGNAFGTSQKAEHVGAVVAQEGLTQPAVEARLEHFLRMKGRVGSPFALKYRPVVRHAHGAKETPMRG